MGGGVAVAADYGVARQGEAVFRTDHVDDAVFRVSESVERHAEFLSVAGEGLDLVARHRVGYRPVLVEGGDVVVRRAVGFFRTEHFEAALAEAFESLRACHLVAVMAVDIELRGSAFDVVDNVCVPDFVKKSFSHNVDSWSVCGRRLSGQ